MGSSATKIFGGAALGGLAGWALAPETGGLSLLMPAAGALIGGDMGGAAAQADASQSAANLEAGAANNATGLEGEEFGIINNEMAPYRQAGYNALPGEEAIANEAPFTQQDFLNNMDPAYQFDFQQGVQGTQQALNAEGLEGPATAKGLTQYSQQMASNEYSNAYNRYMANRNQNYSELQGIANQGLGATNETSSIGAGMVG